MKQLSSACVFLILLTSTLGCYSESSFRSESAAIHDAGFFTSYQYTMMFDRAEVRRKTTVQYAFNNPPPREAVIRVIFENKDDLDLVVAHAAIATVNIMDDSFELVYQFTGPISADSSENYPLAVSVTGQWNFRGFGALNPPPDWQFNRERVSVNPSTPAFPLRHGGYRIEFTLEADGQLPRPVSFHLAIESFGAGSI